MAVTTLTTRTLRVPLDYGFAEARTVYGIIGVKCWINKKEDSDKGALPQGVERRPRRPRTNAPAAPSA